jgi:predicted metalloprotease
MRWSPGGRSGDIEDRRGTSYGVRGFGGLGGRGIGIGGLLVLFVLGLIFKTDFISPLFSPATDVGPAVNQPVAESPEEKKQVDFVSFVLDDAQDTWTRLMANTGVPYRRAKLVLFRGVVESACGMAEAATGPFYCPGDEKAYIDLSFYDELQRRFGAPGDFAQAYVLAHELGHHVQNILGIERKMRAAQRRNPDAANALSVRMELQADCLAGVWGHSTSQRKILEQGDVEEGLNAAAAIGDDRLQRMSRGRVVPESFTHGSSAQRVQWFKRGLDQGSINACDTFQTEF